MLPTAIGSPHARSSCNRTERPVQFEITEPIRNSVFAWIRHAALKTEDCLFPSRLRLPPIRPLPDDQEWQLRSGKFNESLSSARTLRGQTLMSPWGLRSVGVGTPRHRNVLSTPQSSRRGQTATLRTR